MPGEFKVASGYIEVVSKVNERSAKAGADLITATAAEGGKKGGQLAGDGIGKGVVDGAKSGATKAGTALHDGVKPGAKKAGDEIAAQAELGGKDGGKKAGEELGKGTESGAKTLGSKLTSTFGDRGKVAGSAFGDMFGGKLAGLAAAGGVLAAGMAVGGVFMEGYKKAVEQANIGKMIQAKTGADGAAKDYGKMAGDLYAKGFGDSVTQVGDAITQVIQSGVSKLDSSPIDTMAGSALNVAKILGEDVKPVLRDVATLIRTGMAKDSKEAFDILVKGEQSGANAANDLLDTLQEYPVQFEKLGIKGPQAVGLISQAMKAGARSSDLAADSLKEFSIRAVDGSKLTADSFTALGLDAGKMGSDIAAGGDRANGALSLTLDRLRAMPDPVARSQAAVGLFGTQAEDLGKALFAMDPSKAVDSLGKVAGAAKKAGDEVSSTGDKTELFKRKIEQGFVGYIDTQVIPAANKWIDALKGVGDWLDKTGGKGTSKKIGEGAMAILGPTTPDKLLAPSKAIKSLRDSILPDGKEAKAMLDKTWNGVENFFTKTVPGWFGKAADEAGKLPGKVMDKLSDLPGKLSDFIGKALDDMAYAAGFGLGKTVKFFEDLPGNIWDAIVGLPDTIGGIWDSVWSFATPKISGGIDGALDFFKNLPGNIWDALKDIGSTIANIFSGAWDWAKSVVKWGIDNLVWEVKNLPGMLWNLGGDIINGLVNGIENMGGKLWDLAKRLAGNFLGGFRHAFDSNSPSKVMDRIGEHDVGGGLIQGLEKVGPKLPAKAAMMADAFTGGFNGVTVGAKAGNASASGGTSDTPDATGSFGPYVIQLGDRQFASFVIDAVSGAPKQVAAAVDEGRRQRGFQDSARARR